MRVEIYYTRKSPIGDGYSAGSIRLNRDEILDWLQEAMSVYDYPVLIVKIKTI